MSQIRSPAYPAIAIDQAIDLTKKIYDANRTNPIDREAAAREMGFTGLTGTSTKMLSDLSHFGLIEKAGKGGIRVSQRAVDIIYPVSVAGKAAALVEAAASPALFGDLRTHFSDGLPSEAALKSYLMRQGFVSAAIPYVVKSYLETSRFVQGLSVNESHGEEAQNFAQSNSSKGVAGEEAVVAEKAPKAFPPLDRRPLRESVIMEGERVIFVDEAAAGTYLKLIASGEMDDTLLEALEDFTKRWRKRLTRSAGKESNVRTDQEGAAEIPG